MADKDTSRLESFSDGIFAFAMTLLALDLRVPVLGAFAGRGELVDALRAQWPNYAAFAASFMAILIMWINHHGVFRSINRTTPRLFFANGLLLLMVTTAPFTTALVARYLLTPAAPIATAVYAGSYVIISIAYNWLWREVVDCGHSQTSEHHARVTRNYKLGLPIYCAATAAAFFSPFLSLGICAALWVFWAVTMRSA
jgi:uncharacterized membrane protein